MSKHSQGVHDDWNHADEFLAGKVLELYQRIRHLQWLVFALGLSFIAHVLLEGVWPR